jgi:hypothetical protein
MVFCSIDVGAGGKVPFVVICYRAVLKHECHEGTNGTNWVQNDRAMFVKFAHSCYLYRNSGVRDSKPLRLARNVR